MTRPYPHHTTHHAVRRIPTHVHQPFAYHHDPMHMVGHHHERIDVHMRHVFRYRIPTPLHDPAQCIRHHHAICDVPEQMPAFMRANRHVIRTGLGVIVPAQSDGTPMEPFCHVPNIGILC